MHDLFFVEFIKKKKNILLIKVYFGDYRMFIYFSIYSIIIDHKIIYFVNFLNLNYFL